MAELLLMRDNETILLSDVETTAGPMTGNGSASTSFDWTRLMFFNNNTESVTSHYAVIFDPAEQGLLIGLYIMILLLGLIFNGAIIWVIIGRANNRNPRNMYTVNLAISGIMVGVFCVPTTMVQILYGGWWHFGLFACKLVPAIQGANILVSAFTITVIAIDRWRSVTNTNPVDSLSYKQVAIVIVSIWTISFAVMTPLFIYQEIRRVEVSGHLISLMCSENFPNENKRLWNYSFTLMILVIQYVMPLVVLPIVHTKILIFLRKNSGFQNDARRKEREMKRNRRMTLILSCIGIIFAVSWLPYHLYLILTDIFIMFQDVQKRYYLALGICHCVAMTSIFTNPLMYGWFNTSLRSELESLLPKCCQDCLHQSRRTGDPKGRSALSNKGMSPSTISKVKAHNIVEMRPMLGSGNGSIKAVAKEVKTPNLIPRREQQEPPPSIMADTSKMTRNCENKRWV